MKFVSTRYCAQPYCMWCGRFIEDGHSPICPIVHEIQTKNGFIALGIAAHGEPYHDFAALRLGMLVSLWRKKDGEVCLSSGDEECDKRLVYEHAYCMLNVVLGKLKEMGEMKQHPIKKFFVSKRKERNLEKDKKNVLEMLRLYNVPDAKITQLFRAYGMEDSLDA